MDSTRTGLSLFRDGEKIEDRSSADEITTRGTKRQRTVTACKRCKGRKQKCSNTFPCTNCVSANVDCVTTEQGYPASYVRSLEERVAYLETKLQESDAAALDASDHHPDLNKHATPASICHSTPSQVVEPPHIVQGDSFALVALYDATEQSFLGSTSGYPLSRLLQSAVTKQFIVGDSVPKAGPTAEPGPALPASMPDDGTAELLLNTYWEKFHARHPFLWRKDIMALNSRRHELARERRELDEIETQGSPGTWPVQSTTRKVHVALFKLYMLYAISARYLQMGKRNTYKTSPEAYYNAASQEIAIIISIRDLDTIDSLLLLVLYQLRSPKYPGMWHLIRHAMTSSIESGLHRKSRITSFLDHERRKRIFWCVYGLDRAVAMALGRPYSINEKDIDTELPANVDDTINDEESLRLAIQDSISFPGCITAMSASIHTFKLKIIESRIHDSLYCANGPKPVADEEFESILAQLADWKDNIPDAPSTTSEIAWHRTSQFHMIQYYKCIRLLYLPRITTQNSTSKEFDMCIHAAGQICQLLKQIDQAQTISWSLLDLHTAYLAGLTLIYGFWISRQIFSFKFSSDIRACSTILYIIAERWPAATKYRDAFEELVANLIDSSNADNDADRERAQNGCYSQEGGQQLPRPMIADSETVLNVVDQGRNSWQMKDSYLHPVAASHNFGGMVGEQAWEMFEDLIDKNFRNQVRGIHLGIPSYFAP